MSELTTKGGNDVAVEVKRMFGDEDGVQIGDADIVRWINAAQTSIVAVNPVLQRTILRDVISGQQDYVFPADRIQYIQSLSYKGRPLDSYSYPEAQEYIKSADPESVTKGEPLIWYQWAQTLTLFPIPDTDVTDGLRMDYVAIPENLTAISDPLSLPDRYFESIVAYVLQKAHQMEDNFDGAGYVRQQFTEQLAQLSEQENRVSLRQYPSITVRTEDL